MNPIKRVVMFVFKMFEHKHKWRDRNTIGMVHLHIKFVTVASLGRS